MHTIAILKVYWNNTYCNEGYVSNSFPVLNGLIQNWREVDDEEYSNIKKFLKECHSVDCCSSSGYKYIMIEKNDTNFEKDFEKWKNDQIEKEEKKKKREAQEEKLAMKREEKKKAKEIEKAKKLLGLK